jgi:PAS domain S-box-containing protein
MASANEQVLFSIGEVAAIVGLSRHTIRAWERRHRLQPQRTASGQRRYTADDVALLMHVKHAVSQHRLSLKVAFGSAQGELSVPAVQESDSPGLWRSAVDLLPEMILILDVDGFISAANRAASTALGVPPDDLVGRNLADLLERGVNSPHEIRTPGHPQRSEEGGAPRFRGDPGNGTEVRTLLQRACVRRTCFELQLLAVSGRQAWAFDCRPFSAEGTPHLAVIARPPGDLRTGG